MNTLFDIDTKVFVTLKNDIKERLLSTLKEEMKKLVEMRRIDDTLDEKEIWNIAFNMLCKQFSAITERSFNLDIDEFFLSKRCILSDDKQYIVIPKECFMGVEAIPISKVNEVFNEALIESFRTGVIVACLGKQAFVDSERKGK